jgi:H/ACA ribonucleoprotein complex subunit 2
MENKEIDIENLAISLIAVPMASEKLTSKTLSLVGKLAKVKLIKRGVKEVNKFFRRKENKNKNAICVLAGDVSPIDVISHIPILCEKNKMPYIYIPSRQMLGTASQTKRPTSVVILVEPPEDNNYYDSFSKIRKVVIKYNEEE